MTLQEARLAARAKAAEENQRQAKRLVRFTNDATTQLGERFYVTPASTWADGQHLHLIVNDGADTVAFRAALPEWQYYHEGQHITFQACILDGATFPIEPHESEWRWVHDPASLGALLENPPPRPVVDDDEVMVRVDPGDRETPRERFLRAMDDYIAWCIKQQGGF